jgi:glycosyltransferase involved in cell wall biosynthesis
MAQASRRQPAQAPSVQRLHQRKATKSFMEYGIITSSLKYCVFINQTSRPLCSGTPLIASDLPVVRELVTDGVEALLVRPGSAKAIKDGMLKLMSEQRLAERLSSAARCRVEQHFSWKRAQAELLAVYESLLEDSNSRCSSGASLAASVSS